MKSRCTISNPPYNMRWQAEPFAQTQRRFQDFDVPPNSNANFAFILTGMEESDRCVFLLPCSVLRSGTKEEERIKAQLVEKNMLEAVILCPDNMFESTQIATCILVFDKNKHTATTEMIDLRRRYTEEKREQRGQYGGSSHTNRTYIKTVKTISEETMNEVMLAIQERKTVKDFCQPVTIEKIREDKYNLLPSHYFDIAPDGIPHRPYKDITGDINRIIREKNACKLTINESLAKNLGFDITLYKADQDNKDLDRLLQAIGADKLEKENYFATSKNKNEIKFENNSKEILSSILMMILNTWKQHIYYLNTEENRYLAELRDALIPELMTGKLGGVIQEMIGEEAT